MNNEAKKTVTEFLTAVQQGDNKKLGELLHPQVIWNQPGDNLVSGIKSSNMEVFGMVGKMFELTASTLRLTEVKTIAVNGNEVAVLVNWKANKPTGAVLDTDNVDVYTVENGQITRADIFVTDPDQENHFWN